jgi:uncharacterized protein
VALPTSSDRSYAESPVTAGGGEQKNSASLRLCVRITPKEQSIIRESIQALDPESSIYLFGSRVDDHAKGGDIDLLVISDKLEFRDLLKLRRLILDQIGWQQLDLIIKKSTELSQSFVEEAIETGILLT